MSQFEVGMKRTTGDGTDSDGDLKRLRHDDTTTKIRLLLLGKFCGALIGKGGENFARLRRTYDVKITGQLNTPINERVLQLEGSCVECLDVIAELLPSCPEARYPSTNAPTSAPFEINFLVNTDMVGLLIGKGGATMKEVREATGCQLKVYPNCLPNSNERVVSMGAESEDVIIAGLTKAFSILKDAPMRSMTIYFCPENNMDIDPRAMDLGGGGGAGVMSTPASNNISEQPLKLPANLTASCANPLDNNIAMILIAKREMMQTKPIDPRIDFGTVRTSTTLKLSNEMCGAIIGKGGQNINFTRSTSGASVDFTKGTAETGNLREVTISGTQEQVRIAEELINQCVRRSEAVLRNGGAGNMQYQQY